jgi:PAS domain S-box-containing protein
VGGGAAFTEVLDILAEAVTIRDRDGSIVYANRAALESMGFETLDQLKSRSSRSIMDDYLVEDEHGRPLTLEDVPSVRLMRGRPADPLLMHTVHRATGEAKWQVLKTTPIPDKAGTLVAAVTLIEDVTAVKTAEVRTRVLAESGRLLSSSLDYEQTLENVARAAVPALADWCSVDLFDESLRREHAVTAHRDPSKGEFARRLRELQADYVDPQSALWRVLRTGASELVPEITDEQLAGSARSPEHLELMRQLQARSAVIVPLRVPARTIGVLTLVTRNRGGASRRTI